MKAGLGATAALLFLYGRATCQDDKKPCGPMGKPVLSGVYFDLLARPFGSSLITSLASRASAIF